MRLWSIHPKYLDVRGLSGVWREGLLAKKVLEGKTKGYKNHPQLLRFKEQTDPKKAINRYLWIIADEAEKRNYSFTASKLDDRPKDLVQIPVTHDQLLYEFNHLKKKLHDRDKKKYAELQNIKKPEVHPLFTIVAGPVEKWEKLSKTKP